MADVLHQGLGAGASDFADDAGSYGNSFSQCQRRGSRFSLDFDVLGRVVHDADADVIVVKILLNLTHDIAHHLLGIFAGNGRLGDVVEEGEMAGPALLLGKEARIFNSHADLAGRGFHDLQVTGFEPVFALGTESGHHPRGLSAEQDGSRADGLRRARRNKLHAKFQANLLEVTANHQRLASADDVLGKGIAEGPRPLGEDTSTFDLQLEANLVVLLEGDIKGSSVENLAEFNLHRAQNLVPVEMGTDSLTDLGEQFVFFRAPLGLVHDDIVFEGESDLQGQPDQQTQI